MEGGRLPAHDNAQDDTTGTRRMTGTASQFVPDAHNTRDLRHAFGCFGTGVTVVTAATPSGPVGMTANSFSSISLLPPLVLWSPARSSQRHDAFVNASHFCIHVLSDQQLLIATHFANSGTDFGRFEWCLGPHGAPTLNGCLAEFHCDTEAVHPAGDHSLVLGRVRTVVRDGSDAKGLLFARGGFGTFTAMEDRS